MIVISQIDPNRKYAQVANEWQIKPKGAIKNGPFRDTGNIGHKSQNEDKQNKKYNAKK